MQKMIGLSETVIIWHLQIYLQVLWYMIVPSIKALNMHRYVQYSMCCFNIKISVWHDITLDSLVFTDLEQTTLKRLVGSFKNA